MTFGYNRLDLPSTRARRLSQGECSQSLSIMSDSDAALVARTLDGDLDAYAKLMARYRDTLGAYALHMLGTREDAQEAVQDSFVRAYRALRGCRQPGRFGAWLFRIVVNRCRTMQRRLKRNRRFAEPLPEGVPANGDAVASLEWREEIARALARLRPHYREAFLLRYVNGLEYEEMAGLTGAKQAALRMRVKRASDQLRELLRDVHAG
jgi:RNA polymerase sigma-70 factor, ECF subfamily